MDIPTVSEKDVQLRVELLVFETVELKDALKAATRDDEMVDAQAVTLVV